MLNIELSWQEAAVTSVCLLGVAAVARATAAPIVQRPRLASAIAVSQEAGTLFGLFALWQFAGSFSLGSPEKALARAQWIWQAERQVHMPSEALIQRVFLPHPLLVEVFNLYYAALHFIVLIACLIWLFARYRAQYRRARTTVVLFTGASLLVQLVPVAPPRMLPGDGMIDTGIRYGQSVYGTYAGFEPDQLSAMPSVHIGWALLVAILVVHVARSRWRWLILAYPVLTTGVVVITANHFWLDGIVAAMILAAVLLVQRVGRIAQRPALAWWGERRPARWRQREASISLASAPPYVGHLVHPAGNGNAAGNGSTARNVRAIHNSEGGHGIKAKPAAATGGKPAKQRSNGRGGPLRPTVCPPR